MMTKKISNLMKKQIRNLKKPTNSKRKILKMTMEWLISLTYENKVNETYCIYAKIAFKKNRWRVPQTENLLSADSTAGNVRVSSLSRGTVPDGRLELHKGVKDAVKATYVGKYKIIFKMSLKDNCLKLK